MRITGLETQALNPERMNVYVDGKFLLGVSALIVLRMELRIDQELTAEQVEELREEETLQRAVEQALNYLSFRPRSRAEVKRYLRRKETPPELIETVVERLERMNVVNDRDFASFWIESRETFNPRGARALKNELRMKGVERDVVDEMVSSDEDEERAMQAARKKALGMMRVPGMDYEKFRNRLGAFLQRRGFGYDVTSRTVKALWEELSEEAY